MKTLYRKALDKNNQLYCRKYNYFIRQLKSTETSNQAPSAFLLQKNNTKDT